MRYGPSAFVFFLVTLCFAGACGVRTDPRPPEDTAARAPGDFEIARKEAGVELSWERPTKTADGERLYDLSSFVVERAEGAGAFAPIASLPVTDTDRIRTQRTFHYLDASPPDGPLRYRVRAMHLDGEQGLASELLLVGDQAPATPPPSVEAPDTPADDAELEPPAGDAAPAEPSPGLPQEPQ